MSVGWIALRLRNAKIAPRCEMDGRRKDNVFVNGTDRIHNFRIRNNVPEAPSRHRKVFGKAIDGDGMLPHPGKACKRHKRSLEAERRVNIIRHYDKVVLFHDLRNFLHGFKR